MGGWYRRLLDDRPSAHRRAVGARVVGHGSDQCESGSDAYTEQTATKPTSHRLNPFRSHSQLDFVSVLLGRSRDLVISSGTGRRT
jgi:hypothetical protein